MATEVDQRLSDYFTHPRDAHRRIIQRDRVQVPVELRRQTGIHSLPPVVRPQHENSGRLQQWATGSHDVRLVVHVLFHEFSSIRRQGFLRLQLWRPHAAPKLVQNDLWREHHDLNMQRGQQNSPVLQGVHTSDLQLDEKHV